jgi:hypothetical protein
MAMARVIVVKRRVRNFHHPWWRRWMSAFATLVLVAFEGYGEHLMKIDFRSGPCYFMDWPD